MIKVFIVDDHQSYIDGLKALLKNNKEIKIVGEALNGQIALEKIKTTDTDVITLDIDMPKMNGEELLNQIKKNYPSIKILVLTAFNEKSLFNNLITNGINGFRLKNAGIDNIIEAIKNIYEGCNDYNLKTDSDNNKKTSRYTQLKLTKQEKEVVKYIAEGLTNEEIAIKMFLSKYTIENHRNNAISKTKAKNSQELVAIAMRNNLID